MAHLRLAAPSLTAYLAARLLGLLVLWAMAQHFDEHTLELLGKWAGVWFIGIVQDGYDTRLEHDASGAPIRTNIVFFPGYPFLVEGRREHDRTRALHAGFSPRGSRTFWVARMAGSTCRNRAGAPGSTAAVTRWKRSSGSSRSTAPALSATR
jgi:hypothetical protein